MPNALVGRALDRPLLAGLTPSRSAERSSLHRLVPLSAAIASGKMGGMADHPHTIDRSDDATGEDLIEQIAAVRRLHGGAGDVPGGGEALAQGQDHAAQPARVIEQSWED